MSNLTAELSKYYTLTETAEILSISRVTLWKWLKDKKLEGYRIGRETLIEKTAVDTLVTKRSR